MRQALVLLLLALPLPGCAGAGPLAVQVLAGLASGATIAQDIVGIDVSLAQRTPGKTPLGAVLP